MSRSFVLTLLCFGLVCPSIRAEDVIWRHLPMGTTFPLPDMVKIGPGPGDTFPRRYSLAQVFVDGTAGNPGVVETITVFFFDDAPIPFESMPGQAVLNVFIVKGPETLPMPADNPDNGIVVEATFSQNTVDGWIEVVATNLSTTLPMPLEIVGDVRYYIGLTPVFLPGEDPFSGSHIANDMGKANESQSAFRQTSPMVSDWVFAGDLFGPPPELFATVVIDPFRLLGDINGDGIVNLMDVGPFVQLLVLGEFSPLADINEDGVVDLLDVDPFVDILFGGCI